jgi:hypothetical protein
VAAIAVVLCLGLAAFWALTATQQAKAAQLNVILTTNLPGGPLVTAGPWRSGTVTLGVDKGQPIVFEADNTWYDNRENSVTRGCTAWFDDWARWYPSEGKYGDPISTLPKVEYTVPSEDGTITLVARYFWYCG